MPVFCSLLLPSYYSNNFAGKIDVSLTMVSFTLALETHQQAGTMRYAHSGVKPPMIGGLYVVVSAFLVP